MDFLLLHASSAYYDAVVLLAHSMGGLLAADAYACLFRPDLDKDLDKDKDKDKDAEGTGNRESDLASGGSSEQAQTWLGSASAALASWVTYPRSADATADVRFLVPLAGIITIDSPFFGLHAAGVARTGAAKAQSLLHQLPTIVPKIQPALTLSAMNALIPDSVSLPTPIKNLNVPVPTTHIKAVASHILALAESAMPRSHSLNPLSINGSAATQPSSDLTVLASDATADTASSADPQSYWSTTTMVVGATVAAAAALTSAIASPANATALATSHAENMRKHAEFLSPLAESPASQLERVQVLQREQELKKRLHFKGFFLDLIDGDAHNRNFAVSESINVSGEQTGEHVPRYFCEPPPPQVEHLFHSIASPIQDEIDAHMTIFDCSSLGHAQYSWLLDLVSDDIALAVYKKVAAVQET